VEDGFRSMDCGGQLNGVGRIGGIFSARKETTIVSEGGGKTNRLAERYRSSVFRHCGLGRC